MVFETNFSQKRKGAGSRLVDAQNLAARFPPLLIEAERVAQSIWQGVHGRHRPGVGETFWQFRSYETGDSAHRIDWRQSARTDKLFIREREWEATQTTHVWADRSGSMHYSSHNELPLKMERAQLLMLALASLLLRGGEKVAWLDGRTSVTAHGVKGLQNITAHMNSVMSQESQDPSVTRSSESQILSLNLPPDLPFARHAHMILCSDFLTDMTKLTSLVEKAAAQHVKGVLLHILDPLEDRFALQGRVQLHGLEGEAPFLLHNAKDWQKIYHERLEAHQNRLTTLASWAGWRYSRHITNAEPASSLLTVYEALTTHLH